MYVMFLAALCTRRGSPGLGHLATLVVKWAWHRVLTVAVNGVVAQTGTTYSFLSPLGIGDSKVHLKVLLYLFNNRKSL